MRRGTLREFMRSTEYDAGRDMLRLVSACSLLWDRHSADETIDQLEEAADGLVYLHAQGVVHGDINDVHIQRSPLPLAR
jgi:serine/threonine protein kinase